MELILRDIHLPMRHPFTIALGTTTVQHNLLVELRQDGVSGYGEGASTHGYEEFTATMLPDNRRALALMHKLSPETKVTWTRGEYEAHMPLPHAS